MLSKLGDGLEEDGVEVEAAKGAIDLEGEAIILRENGVDADDTPNGEIGLDDEDIPNGEDIPVGAIGVDADDIPHDAVPGIS